MSLNTAPGGCSVCKNRKNIWARRDMGAVSFPSFSLRVFLRLVHALGIANSFTKLTIGDVVSKENASVGK